ncbi:fasciclin domain-containing protein [Pedobacter sp. BAL39]|uniref:fasciclin domain-containing protein n=1 Tax=Pedobacter sp. BAL39 TaxID=391596 RepID=UPI0012F9A49D|nr:fasciclin domain-containing protein [Pedobacter sp. BAL39]
MNHLTRISTISLYMWLAIVGCSLMFIGCKKDDTDATKKDFNTITSIIADNFNLSIYNTALIRSGLANQMMETGPFTSIAPSDAAFGLAGFTNTTAILSADPSRVSSIMNYHILNGRYDLNKMPFLFNQEVRSSNGGKLFVTHWVKGADTVLTINGAKVLSKNVAASNGLIQVVDRVLEPYTQDLVVNAIAADRQLSLFYQALQRAGLLELLHGNGPYTIFAPNNAAMTAFGLSSLKAINETEPAVLQRLMRYHIIADRRFVYDYILSTGTSNRSEQAMIDGNSVQIRLIPNPQVSGAYTGIQLMGTGNTSPVTVVKQDLLTGNGVVHTISSLLKITQ